jgi:hypothetical protein
LIALSDLVHVRDINTANLLSKLAELLTIAKEKNYGLFYTYWESSLEFDPYGPCQAARRIAIKIIDYDMTRDNAVKLKDYWQCVVSDILGQEPHYVAFSYSPAYLYDICFALAQSGLSPAITRTCVYCRNNITIHADNDLQLYSSEQYPARVTLDELHTVGVVSNMQMLRSAFEYNLPMVAEEYPTDADIHRRNGTHGVWNAYTYASIMIRNLAN